MNQQIIESGHKAVLESFKQLYVASKPSFKELQAQERREAVAKIKNILFADLLIKIIKTNSDAGHETPAEFDLQILSEIL